MDKLKQRLISFYKDIFNDSDIFTNWFFDNFYKKNNAFYFSENGEIISALFIVEKNFKSNDKILKCGFIVGAGTKIEYRRKNYMRNLIEKVKSLKRFDFLALYPDVKNFYEKFDFVTVEYGIKPAACKNLYNLKQTQNYDADKFYREYKNALNKFKPLLYRDYYIEDFEVFLDWVKKERLFITECEFGIAVEDRNMAEMCICSNYKAAQTLSSVMEGINFSLMEQREEAEGRTMICILDYATFAAMLDFNIDGSFYVNSYNFAAKITYVDKTIKVDYCNKDGYDRAISGNLDSNETKILNELSNPKILKDCPVITPKQFVEAVFFEKFIKKGDFIITSKGRGFLSFDKY